MFGSPWYSELKQDACPHGGSDSQTVRVGNRNDGIGACYWYLEKNGALDYPVWEHLENNVIISGEKISEEKIT